MPEIYQPTPEDQQLFDESQAMFDEFANSPKEEEELGDLLSVPPTTDEEPELGNLLAVPVKDDPYAKVNVAPGLTKGDVTFAYTEVKDKGLVEGAKSIFNKVTDRIEELTIGQYQRGKLNERIGLLYNKFLQTGDEQFKVEAQQLEQQMPPEPEMESIPSKIVGYSSVQLPQYPGRVAKGIEQGLEEDTGSQMELGDRISRGMLGGWYPAVNAAKGFLFDYNNEVMAGHAYAELDKIVDPNTGQGIDEEIKQRYAKIVGATGAVIENASLIPLGKLVPGGSKVLGEAINQGTLAMLKSGAFKDIVVRGTQVVAGEVVEEMTQQTSQWIANEVAKNTMNELLGTNMPPEDITYLGKRLKDAFLPTVYASIGLGGGATTLGMSTEAVARFAGKEALKAEARYNLQRDFRQTDEELTAANQQLAALRTSLEDEDLAYEDALEDDLAVETFSEDLVTAETPDRLTQIIDQLMSPQEEGTGYSLAEHRATENALKEARLSRSALTREMDTLETSGRVDNAKIGQNQAKVVELDTRINELSTRAQAMRQSQRVAAQRAVVNGQWESYEEARTIAGKGMGVSKQELADAREENRQGFQALRQTRQELNDLRQQEKELEQARETGKRRSPAQKALRDKIKGLKTTIREERTRLMEVKDNLDMMEGKTGSEVAKRLDALRGDLKEAGTLGEKSFDAALPELEKEEILAFRNAIYKAWRDAKAAVTAGDKQGYARGKEVIRALIAKQRVKQKIFRLQKKMVGDIKKMIRAGAKKSGRVDADTNVLFSSLRSLLGSGAEKVDRDELVAQADAGDFQAQISLKILEMKERAKNKDFSFLKQLHDEIRAVYLGGKEARQIELDSFRTQVNESIAKIKEEIRGPFDIQSRQEGKGLYIDNIKNFFSFLGVDWLYALRDTVAAIVQDSGTHFYDTEAYRITETIDEEKTRQEIERTYTEEMINIYAQAYGISPGTMGLESNVRAQMNKEAFSEREEIAEGFSYNITELRKLYMLIKNERTRQHFIENQGFTEEVLQAVEQRIESSPKDLAIVNGQFAIMETIYEKINKVYRKLNGYNLPKQEFYTHIKREYSSPDDINAQTLADVLLGVDFTNASVDTTSALQRRTTSKLPIKIVPDVLDTMDYVRQMAHYIAFAEKARLWNSVFRSPDFISELRRKYGTQFGDKLQAKLNRHLDDTIRGRRSDKVFRWEKVEDLMGLVVKVTLAAKAKIAFGQMTSMILYLDQMERKEFIVGVNEFLKDPQAAADFMDANSSYFKGRSWRTDQTLIKQFGDLQHGKNKKVEQMKFWLSETGDKMMSNVVLGDKVASYIGGYAMTRALSKRMSLKAAIRRAEIYTRDTQQSAEMSVQSLLQKGGTGERMLTMYASQQMGMLRVQMRDMRDFFNSRGRYLREKSRLAQGVDGVTPETVARYREEYRAQRKRTAKTQAIFQIASPLLFAWVSAGFDWDWPEEIAAGMGALNAVPLVGEVFEGQVRSMLGLPRWGSELVVTQFLNDYIKAGEDLLTDQDTVMKDVATLLQPVTGIPVKTLVGMLQGISDMVLEENIHSGILRTMGYSEKVAEKAAEN